MRALLVDDDPAIRLTLSAWLQRAGWELETAGDAQGAREKLARGGFDLVLLDFVLPDADGVELVREWRRAGDAPPIVVVTAAQSESVVEELLRAGAHDIVDKTTLRRDALLEAVALARGPPPLSPAPPRPRAPVEDDPLVAASKPGRALVVDDVESWRLRARLALEHAGWRVETAGTATDALRATLARPFDVLVLDYLLPDVDGAGLLHELRRRGDETPVVVLSAHGRADLAEEFVKAGAAEFLPKDSFSATALLDAMARAREASGVVRSS